jgi:RNA polymerase II-associated protein 3
VEASETPKTTTVSDHLTPISSRPLPTKDMLSSSHNEDASSTKPSNFKEAKEVRESTKTSRVGGGIFRATGNHTLFKSKDVSPTKNPEVDQEDTKPEPKKPTSSVTTLPSVSTVASLPAQSSETPLTLFDFIRKWQRSSSSADHWALLCVRIIPFQVCVSLY